MVKKNYRRSNVGNPYAACSPAPPTSANLYRPEATPLLPPKVQRRSTSCLCQVVSLCLLVMLSFTTYYTLVHYGCPPDSFTRDAIRREWEQENAQHAVLEREWNRKAQAHDAAEQDWTRKREEHEKEVNRRIHEEHERQAMAREEWKREAERHARELEARDRLERSKRELERQRWRQEIEERERREEEERQRLRMYWGNVQAHTCTTYATRGYTAQLMNLPRSWGHRVEACKATPLDIHGISYLPKACEDKGPGVVQGRWEIDQQEPACTTYWGDYDDKGCTLPGSGKRYFTHKLMNLPDKSDWQEFCATTPIHFNNMAFPGAEECFSTVFGIYGRWEIEDSGC